MSRKSRFVVAGIILVAASVAVTLAVSAAVPSNFLPAGTTHYAVSSVSSASTHSLTFGPVPGLYQTFYVPGGAHADILIFFCGDFGVTLTNVNTYMRAVVNGALATPSIATIDGGLTSLPTRCANFNMLNVPSGTKTVRMQWSVSNGAATANMQNGTMTLIVNIH